MQVKAPENDKVYRGLINSNSLLCYRDNDGVKRAAFLSTSRDFLLTPANPSLLIHIDARFEGWQLLGARLCIDLTTLDNAGLGSIIRFGDGTIILREELGRGTHGVVYLGEVRAEDQTHLAAVAVKRSPNSTFDHFLNHEAFVLSKIPPHKNGWWQVVCMLSRFAA
jgi:hypothetical protein